MAYLTPAGLPRIPDPQPLALAIPAFFTSGSTIGNVTAIDAYTARIQMSPPLQIPSDMVANLVNADVSYTQPNMGSSADGIPGYAAGNNRISIDFDALGLTDYLVPAGLYGYPDLALALNQIAVTAGWVASLDTPLFTMRGVASSQKIVLGVSPAGLAGGVFPAGGIVLDFTNVGQLGLNDSMGRIVGFPVTGGGATLTVPGGGSDIVYFDAPNIADFATTSAYVVYMSFLRDSSFNGGNGKFLYKFGLGDATPNTVASYQPPQPYLVPCVAGSYSSVDVYWTDQSGNRLKLQWFQAPLSLSVLIDKKR